MTDVRALFENDDWTVTADALEHKATGYAIDREQVGRRRIDGFWAWPLHMLEKNWVAPETFAEAFSAAARLFGLDAGDTLAATFEEAGWKATAFGWRRRTAEIVTYPPPSDAAPEERAAKRRRQGG